LVVVDCRCNYRSFAYWTGIISSGQKKESYQTEEELREIKRHCLASIKVFEENRRPLCLLDNFLIYLELI